MAFSPMLSGTCEDTSKLRYPVLGSPKLDGIRALVRGAVLVSRNLKPIRNVELQMRYGRAEYEGLDGELIDGPPGAPDCFLRTSSTVMSTNKPAAGVLFYVFDVWNEPEVLFAARLRLVETRKKVAKLVAVPHKMLHNAEALAVYEAEQLTKGYEGVMLRDPAGPYKQGRSTENEGWLLKLKQFADAEAVVVGVEEQMANENEATKDALGHTKRSTHKAGKRGKDTLGALRVRGLNGPYKGREFSIGSGFDDALRAKLWAERPLDRIVKYKYFPSGSKDAPRFPVFLGFRDGSDM